MEAGISAEQREQVIKALDTPLAMALVALVEVVKNLNLDPKSNAALANASATLPDAPIPTAGRIETVKSYQPGETCAAVAGTVTVNGQQFDTLLSEGSFDMSRAVQTEYAKSLVFRFATREEHRAYVDSLLVKEDAGAINEAENKALKIYRKRQVRDDQDGLCVVGRSVVANDPHWGVGPPLYAALFVRPSAESK